MCIHGLAHICWSHFRSKIENYAFYLFSAGVWAGPKATLLSIKVNLFSQGRY